MNVHEAPCVGSWYCTLLSMMKINFVVYKFVACICFSVIIIYILKYNTFVFFKLSHEKPVLKIMVVICFLLGLNLTVL